MSSSVRAELQTLGRDFALHALDLRRIEDAGAEVLGGLGAAGHAETQAVQRRPLKVAGGDVAGQERVP